MRILTVASIFLILFTSSSIIKNGFVYIRDIDNSITVDLRYYSDLNFTGKPVEGYYANNGILTKQAADALSNAQKDFKKLGYSLVIFDAYRPQLAVDSFIDWSKDLNDTINKANYYPNFSKSELFSLGYIAFKSGHSRGSTVDVSLINLLTGEQVDMGTIYDFFGVESSTFYPNISDSQKSNRMILFNVMNENGFNNYSKEWWHFTLENEPFQEYFNFLVR